MLGTSVSTPVLAIKWEATGEEDAGDCGSPQAGKSLAAQARSNPIQRTRMKAVFLILILRLAFKIKHRRNQDHCTYTCTNGCLGKGNINRAHFCP